jgi:hypothetical protein
MEDQNFVMWAGEAKEIRIPCVDENGDALTLTGATIAWELRARQGAAALVTKGTGGSGITLETTDATDDTVVIALEPEDTAALRGVYLHEAAITGAQAAFLSGGVVTINASYLLGA